MKIKRKELAASGTKFYLEIAGKEIARAYFYILKNDLHEKPFGLMEDVFVDLELRGKDIGSTLVKEVIEEAKRAGCYKLICTSRHEKSRVHELYKRLGFNSHGIEFRMDF